jgi:aspartyl-tRNA(Asn)/glutamyl-tRNA(Gln) amidotransferase subunit C
MIKKEEILHAANLIRIELDDHARYVDQIEKILNYFDILDKGDAESESFVTQEISLDKLRDDKHIPYDEKLILQLKNYKETFVKAPKMT